MSGSTKNPPKGKVDAAGAGSDRLRVDLAKSNVFQLKGGASPAAGVGGGGIRTPIKSAPAPAPSKQGSGTPAVASNATPIVSPRIVSQIRGLNDESYGLSGTALGTVMYDSSAGKRSKMLIAFLIALILAAAFGAVMFPKERKKVLHTLTTAKDDVIGLVRYRKKKQPKGREASEEEGQFVVDADKGRNPRAVKGATGPDPFSPKRSCAYLVQQGVGAGARLTLADQVDLAECYLVQDDLLNAENALRSAEAKIQRATEAELNGMKSSRTLADAFHALMTARLRAGKTREAGDLLRGRCKTWSQTNTCVAKAMLLADRRVPGGGEGVQVLFNSTGRLDGKAQARLWLAGALLSVADGKVGVADQRYAMALASAPKAALALRKQIYETQSFGLYNRGEMARLKASTASAIAELSRLGVPKKPLLKLQMFQDLSAATPKTRSKVVKGLLTREDLTYRARGDFDLIEVLGPESIRAGVEDDYLRLLKRTRDFYESKYKTLGLIDKRLSLWEIRATLSRERYEAVLPLIDRFEKTNGADSISHHLRGIAFLQMADAGTHLTAAGEFQAAMKSKRNWESLYALGVTLTRAGKSDSVAQIIKDLDKMITTNGQRYWVEMLKAEWYTEKGKYLNAQKILTDWQKKKSDYVVPRQLLMKLFKKTGKNEEGIEVENELVALSRTQRPQSSFEGFASPLGVMALAHRPID